MACAGECAFKYECMLNVHIYIYVYLYKFVCLFTNYYCVSKTIEKDVYYFYTNLLIFILKRYIKVLLKKNCLII